MITRGETDLAQLVYDYQRRNMLHKSEQKHMDGHWTFNHFIETKKTLPS